MTKILEQSIIFNEDKSKAMGLTEGRPYEFEIVMHFENEGYSCEVLDFYPAKDSKNYYWEAYVKKRDPQIIPNSTYRKITNMSGLDGWNIRFGIEEMQEILIAHGYEIFVHIAKAEITETRSEDCGVRPTGRKWIENVEKILALKPEDKLNLPEWNDSYRASYLNFESVFNRLMKSKLAKP